MVDPCCESEVEEMSEEADGRELVVVDDVWVLDSCGENEVEEMDIEGGGVSAEVWLGAAEVWLGAAKLVV